MSEDLVNSPKHYTNRKMEAIDIIEMIIEIEHDPKVAYNLSNVLKYLLRFRDKHGSVDLKKAQWYLDRMVRHVEDGEDIKFEQKYPTSNTIVPTFPDENPPDLGNLFPPNQGKTGI